MRIAILTLPFHTNYGGILQAYALQKILIDKGYSVEVLDKKPEQSSIFFRRFLNKIHSIVVRYTLKRHLSKFINTYIKIRKVNNLKELTSTDYDTIIVGSDQIWRAIYFKGSWKSPIEDAFLDFTKGWKIKRISYAASFGLDFLERYSKTEIEKCGNLITTFDKVSVREDSGISICKNNWGITPTQVLDPTMLLSKEDYIQLIERAKIPSISGNLYCYILDPTEAKTTLINKIATEKKLTPFFGLVHNNEKKRIGQTIPSIETWLRGFWDAKLIITDSFHGCVFSIIFGKPFIAIGNANRGMSRFLSLLKLFNLENNLIDENSKSYPSEIKIADKNLLQSYRKESLSFLDI